MKRLLYLLQLLFIVTASITTSKAQSLLDPKTQPKFINPLPIPPTIDGRNGGTFNIAVTQFQQDLGLIDPFTKQPLTTTVWGYNGSYPGPTILAKQNKPLNILWENKLESNSRPLPHLLPIDASINWALSGRSDWKTLGVPLVTHLHGGHTESASDGLPEAWYTPNFALKGPDFVKQTLHYSNDQEAAPLWYHDHTMGITRLNVYAGLAGYYLLTDDNEINLQASNKIPARDYDLGIVIQDRMFTDEGQLYFPTMPASAGVPEFSIMPEFFGDFILVNGKAWPYLEVEPRPYRFRILNGSDSRYYNLHLSSGQTFTQIGSDGGLFLAPVSINQLLIGTGERKDVVIDFSNYSGQTIIMRNNAKTPFPKGSTVNPQTTGQIMAFKVTKALSNVPKAVLPATLRSGINRLQTNLPARKLILFESEDEYGRIEPLLGTYEEGKKMFEDPITETPKLNSTEVWEIYNETEDAHTIHLHLVQMQLISRQKFTASIDMTTGKPTNVNLLGNPKSPDPEEEGWKDTYVMYPGEVTRVIAKFDLPGKYVWHCHILSHEDHEMMRPYLVQGANSSADIASSQTTIAEATVDAEQDAAFRTLPNPFNKNLNIQFNLKQASRVRVNVYDSKGGLVKQVYSGKRNAGLQQFNVDGTSWSNGTYFCEVIINNQRIMRKLVLQK